MKKDPDWLHRGIGIGTAIDRYLPTHGRAPRSLSFFSSQHLTAWLAASLQPPCSSSSQSGRRDPVELLVWVQLSSLAERPPIQTLIYSYRSGFHGAPITQLR